MIGSLRTETLQAEPNMEALNRFREKYGLQAITEAEAATKGATQGERLENE